MEVIVNNKIYNEYMEFKSRLLEYLITEIFNYFNVYVDSGDLIFTGSIIYDRLDIIKKKYFNDIDISINLNENGNNILKSFNQFLSNIELENFNKEYNIKFKSKLLIDNKELDFHNIIVIDTFRNNHPENSNEYNDIEIFPNVYSKYFGHEWNLSKIYKSYLIIKNIDNEVKRTGQYEKFKNIFENYFKYIDINEFQDKLLLYNIINIIKT